MSFKKSISIAYTPDSDDAFYYYALQTGKLATPGYELTFTSDHINRLNQAAQAELFDITAVSSVAYPALAADYRILSVGTSVGRGYGPVLVGKKPLVLEELCGKRVGVAGIQTTGGLLMKWARPEVEVVEMEFDKIADAVVAGELDAGVMIHEELLFFRQKGLVRIADLGALWSERTGMPLPVGLNLIRRDLGWDVANELCDLVRQSLLYALSNNEEAQAWAGQFGRGHEGGCTEQFISMFANEDSVLLPQDVREALKYMMQVVHALDNDYTIPELDFIDGSQQLTGQIQKVLAA